MVDGLLESAALLLAVLTPLVAVPLTVITFYLRSLREQQHSCNEEFRRRVEAAEESIAGLRTRIRDSERDCTTKEEWLRESMYVRRTLEELTAARIRVEADLKTLSSNRPATPIRGSYEGGGGVGRGGEREQFEDTGGGCG